MLYTYQQYPDRRPVELDNPTAIDHINTPALIIGAGPIGLAAAIDLALHGIGSIVLDDNNQVSVGSRAICWSKKTLEVFDRLGVAERMLAKGITWKIGRLFLGDDEVFSFDLLKQQGHKMPAFINLQQYYVEQYLIERCADFPDLIDIRWNNRLTNLHQHADYVTAEITTPYGDYKLNGNYLLACDGAKSTVQKLMGLELEGEQFEERFLITDIEMQADFPDERWFWFKPTFHHGQTALLHKQADNIYRLDLQLGWDADPEYEKQEKIVMPRVQKALQGRPFKLDWVSIYQFRCAKLANMVHQRVIFAGDSAHVVSPFGARGGNGGIQDIDNLCWKLAAILKSKAPTSLLDSYQEERSHGAKENLRHSSQTANFMSPPNDNAMLFREQVLRLAKHYPFARNLINSGRLSTPCSYANMSLITPHTDHADTSKTNSELATSGDPCPDIQLKPNQWLLEQCQGKFVLLTFDTSFDDSTTKLPDSIKHIQLTKNEFAEQRYQYQVYLIRPDQHIAATWEQMPDLPSILTAYQKSLGE